LHHEMRVHMWGAEKEENLAVVAFVRCNFCLVRSCATGNAKLQFVGLRKGSFFM
jgi:hypothetical protein